MPYELSVVSVVIPTYNRGQLIADAINSVLAQTYKNIEIIVVDDGSTDETRELIVSNYPMVKYIYQENQGVSAARNTGIQNASGDFIAFLDSDDIWLPQKLEIQMEVFRKDPAVIMVAGRRVKIKLNDPLPIAPISNKTNTVSFSQLLMGKHIPTPSVVIRRQILKRIGGVKTNLSTGEDWDLWLRLTGSGKIVEVDCPVVVVREVSHSLSKNRFEIYKNNIHIFDSWNPLKNQESPVNPLLFRMIVRRHFYSAVVKLIKNGQDRDAQQLWHQASQTFNFGRQDFFWLRLYALLRGIPIERLRCVCSC